MTTDCMHTCSLLTAIRCGGTGDGTGALPDQDSALAGDGLLHGIIAAGILRGILLGIRLIGMMVTGAATGVATGVATGDQDGIITIIRTGPEIIVEDIPITVRQDIRDILLPDEML